MGKNFVGDTSLSENFSWVEANHKNNEIKSTTKIFTYTVCISVAINKTRGWLHNNITDCIWILFRSFEGKMRQYNYCLSIYKLWISLYLLKCQ